jgi:hypothetical protein
MSDKNNLKEKGFILAHGSSPWSADSRVSGPVVRQSILADRIWWHRAAQLMRAREKERERKGSGTRQASRALPLKAYLLQLGHTS